VDSVNLNGASVSVQFDHGTLRNAVVSGSGSMSIKPNSGGTLYDSGVNVPLTAYTVGSLTASGFLFTNGTVNFNSAIDLRDKAQLSASGFIGGAGQIVFN